MAVANGHFQTALSSSNLSALRETASETAFTLLLLNQITIFALVGIILDIFLLISYIYIYIYMFLHTRPLSEFNHLLACGGAKCFLGGYWGSGKCQESFKRQLNFLLCILILISL
jgi:hypothetical protein